MTTSQLIATGAAGAGGLALAIAVTRNLHATAVTHPQAFWSKPLGIGRLIRADFPLGGAVALAASMIAPEALQSPLRAAATGLAAGALGTGLLLRGRRL